VAVSKDGLQYCFVILGTRAAATNAGSGGGGRYGLMRRRAGGMDAWNARHTGRVSSRKRASDSNRQL
jgi:hypothetical protein